MEPERQLGARPLLKTLALWGSLLIAISAAWAFERHSRGYTAWQILNEVPWAWLAIPIAIVGGLFWWASRLPLHFHLPRLFFIFDSRAERMMRLVSPAPQRNSKRGSRGGDPQYELFVVRALALREQLEGRFGVRLTPRQLDRVLLMLEARQLRDA